MRTAEFLPVSDLPDAPSMRGVSRHLIHALEDVRQRRDYRRLRAWLPRLPLRLAEAALCGQRCADADFLSYTLTREVTQTLWEMVFPALPLQLRAAAFASTATSYNRVDSRRVRGWGCTRDPAIFAEFPLELQPHLKGHFKAVRPARLVPPRAAVQTTLPLFV